MIGVSQHASFLGLFALCAALGLARSTYYRRQRRRGQPKARLAPPRSLAPAERQEVLDFLHSRRFVDRTPAEAVYTLLQEEQPYLCSPRTMYRILEANPQIHERRDQPHHPAYSKPKSVATGPNQEHRHTGIAYLTPYQVHYGLADAALDQRHQLGLAAYEKTPERFVNWPPTRDQLPEAVGHNPPPGSHDLSPYCLPDDNYRRVRFYDEATRR